MFSADHGDVVVGSGAMCGLELRFALERPLSADIFWLIDPRFLGEVAESG